MKKLYVWNLSPFETLRAMVWSNLSSIRLSRSTKVLQQAFDYSTAPATVHQLIPIIYGSKTLYYRNRAAPAVTTVDYLVVLLSQQKFLNLSPDNL